MKKNLNVNHTKEKISDKIGFTKDIMLGETIITIEGNKELFIENYKGIISYDDKAIIVQGKRCKVCIEGKNLQIEYYTNLDMKIKGIICNVNYM